MRQLSKSLPKQLLTGLLACGIAMPALAQRGDDVNERRTGDVQQNRQQRDGQRDEQFQRDDRDQRKGRFQRDNRDQRDGRFQRDDRRDRVDRGRQQDERRQDDRQQRARDVRLEPAGWVHVGVDYDNDGRFDAIETIYAFDLETARQESERRRGGAMRGRQMRDQGARDQRSATVEGEIRDLREIRMYDEDASYLVGRVATDRGRTAKVLLGKDEQLSELDLQEGDRIQVEGRKGSVNQQTVLIASRVRSGDQQVQVSPKKRSKHRKQQVRGAVLRSRDAEFRGHDDTFLIAELRTNEGQRRLVNLGPKDKFEEVDFSDAGEIRVLGHQGRVNGRPALIAEQVHVDGETVKVKPDERRDERWRTEQREREARGSEKRDSDRDREGRRGQRFDDRRDDRDQEREARENQRDERRLLDGRRLDRERRDGGLLNRGDRDRRLLDRENRGDRSGRLLNREGRNQEQRDQGDRNDGDGRDRDNRGGADL